MKTTVTRLLPSALAPVSYTHLDVYKRQVVGQARLERIVAGYQQFAGTALGAYGKDGLEVAHAGLRPQAQNFHIEHLDAGIAQTLLGPCTQGGICLLYTSRCV